MANAAVARSRVPAIPESSTKPLRHASVVRATHWLTAACFIALVVSGIEVLISHPRFYWGETGNVNMAPLFTIPIPASRHGVPTGYGYVLPDQNGWSRALHFQTAWALVFTALVYGIYGIVSGHFRKHILPLRSELTRAKLKAIAIHHLRFQPIDPAEAWTYNVLQRITYALVIFVVFPLMIWTGLAMSPAIAGAFPSSVSLLGGQQSARTIHFFGTLVLVAFLVVHIVMVWRAGLKSRMRAMMTGEGESR